MKIVHTGVKWPRHVVELQIQIILLLCVREGEGLSKAQLTMLIQQSSPILFDIPTAIFSPLLKIVTSAIAAESFEIKGKR